MLRIAAFLALVPPLLGAGCWSQNEASSCTSRPASYQCTAGRQVRVDGCGNPVGQEIPCACGCAPTGDLCAECTCTPDCSATECGPDPLCGVSCGTCKTDETCRAGSCVAACKQDCTGRVCGPDPVCNESCGDCDNGFACNDGECVPVCIPDCTGRECGPDPICNQSCGDCDSGAICEKGACVTHCAPDCRGRNCGLDPACGQTCGDCGPEQACSAHGRCVAAAGWRQTWGDEFNGPATSGDPCYDSTKTPPMCLDRYWSRTTCPADVIANLAQLDKCTWSVYDIYNWMDWGKPWGTGMNNLDPHEVTVTGGELHLTAHAAPQAGQPWDCGNPLPNDYLSKHCPVRSGAVMSRAWQDSATTHGFQQAYGRFEVRAVLPAGPGAWPAHWLLPQDGGWPEGGEIDIMEATWNDPNRAAGNFHGGTYDGDLRTHYSPGDFGHDPLDARFTTGWHVYAAEWDPDEIRFFIDDLQVGRVRQGQMVDATIIGASDPSLLGQSAGALPLDIPASAFFWILNTSVVPNGGLQQDLGNFTPLDHRIDYVRVFERCTTPSPGCSAASPTSRIVTRSDGMSASTWSAQTRAAFVGDFDGDLRDDLLLQGRTLGTPSLLLLSDLRGGFRTPVVVDSLYGMTDVRWTGEFRTIEVGDFDGNAADDLLLRALTPLDDTFLLLADGQGGFRTFVDVTDLFGMSKAAWSASGSRAFVADFDGDGRDDILLQALDGTGVSRLLRGNDQGGFDTARDVTTSPGLTASHWGDDHHRLIVGDFDADHAADVLLQARDTIRPTVLVPGNPAGGFKLATDVTDAAGMNATRWAASFRTAATADIDGDGDTDVVLQSAAQGQASYLLRSDGAGGFQTVFDVTTAFGMNQTMWIAETHLLLVGDFDGDGRDDLLLANHAADARTYLLRGNASGGFENVVDVTDGGGMSAELWRTRDGYAADYDGDGRRDVLLEARDDQHDTFVVRVVSQ